MNTFSGLLSDTALAIFLFHGVVERHSYAVRNYTLKHIERERFIDVLTELKSSGCAITIDQVVDCVTTGTPFPPRSFVVSFDDGFENNYSVACPILSDMHIPAVFYVSTDFIERNTMSWIDRIELCLENCPAGSLVLPWRREQYEFSNDRDKINLLDNIRLHVKNSSDIAVETLVDDIFSQCNVSAIYTSEDPLDKKMSWGQVRELCCSDNFIIGGHTHTHAIMSFLPLESLVLEVETSLRLLRDRAGIETRHYSYPEGMSNCYSQEVVSVLRKVGIKCCPTAIPGINTPKQDLFHLYRITVT